MAVITKLITYDPALASYWSSQSVYSGTTVQDHDPNGINGSQVALVFTRAVASTVHEDVALFTLHLCGEPGVGENWAKLDATQAAAVETVLNAWWTTCKPKVSADWTLKEYQWRDFGASLPISSRTGLSLPTPTWRITTVGVAATGVGTRLPDQVAATVTFKTSSRKHWGRIYMPGLITGDIGTQGKLTAATYVDVVAGAFDTMRTSLLALGLSTRPVIWSAKYRAVLEIIQTQMDDVPDVIRSRRAKFPTYKKQYSY